ncbi:MAG: tetratricopeptide repeat protein [Verrucomicrobia bacterium]|jgi:tetratricopeptide (TPR) repeat protein|nr:tetratricopeptide repeat protein [Verrucomicrobiota bacterium]
MTKRSFYIILALLCGACWLWYGLINRQILHKQELIEKIQSEGDLEEKAADLESELIGLEGQQTFKGILLTFLTSGVIGILFVAHVLPVIVQRFTHAVYDSGEMVDYDVMRDARSLLAQGEYEAAIEEFRNAILAEPSNRMPWMEIAKIEKDHLDDPQAAIETLGNAIETVAWPVDDASFFMFRLAELHEQINGDHAAAAALMQQVVELYPNTRHAANANHRLQELGQAAESAALAAQEREFLERMNLAEKSEEGLSGGST